LPTVSVVIPTYNRASYILDAIESVALQTYTDIEIIVVDDGSADQTSDLLQPLIAAGKIHYIYQDNQGVSSARNHGIRLARGKYIAFLDSDDIWDSSKLDVQTAFLDSNLEVAMIHNSFSRVDIDGTLLGSRDTSRISGWVYPDILLDWSVLIPPSCVMVRKSVLNETGGFDENLRWGEDIDLWRRIAKRYPIGVIPEYFTTMRVHGENVSVAKAQLEVLKSFEYYLHKAFAEDPQLSGRFHRLAFAKLYSNYGHNVLAEGDKEQMVFVRQYSMKAIQQWPFQWSAYLGWLGSFLGGRIRKLLLMLWRKYRYN